MKFTQVPSQYSKRIKEVQATIKVWVHAKAPSRRVSCKSSAALPHFQTMNCTPAEYQLQKSMGQTTDRNRAMFPSLFGMKFTLVRSQYSKGIGEVKAAIDVWVRAKAPSCCVSCESSAALWLFKQ
jgi:hypothetical protein